MMVMKGLSMTLLSFLTMILFPGFTACSPGGDVEMPATQGPAPDPAPAPNPDPGPAPNPDPPMDQEPNPSTNTIKVMIGTAVFPATLSDNATAKAFKTLLPMTVRMNELNGNEKLYYLPESLPSAASNPGRINAGELMLWGGDCLVLFYETFSTSYSYTSIGRIDDAAGLRSAVGSTNVTVRFELQK